MAGKRRTNDENPNGRTGLLQDLISPIIRDIFFVAMVTYLSLSFLDILRRGSVRYFLSLNILAAAILLCGGFVMLTYTDKVGTELGESQAGEPTVYESLLIVGLVLSVVALVFYLVIGSGRANLFLFMGIGLAIIVSAVLTEAG